MTFALAVVATWYAFNLLSDSDPGEQVQISAPVLYESLQDVVEATDATLVVKAISEPRQEVDFGLDGKPDHADDEGLPVEVVDVEILEVLSGDVEVGSTLTFIQPRTGSQDEDFSDSDRLNLDGENLILAYEIPNHPLGNGKSTWYAPGKGQGIFDVDASDEVSVRDQGVFPETFGRDGSKEIPLDEIAE
ncbi:hypothetical protein GCM10010401_05070 [Rarobacter faecitabidus]|uniref:hypothetical protein n=1 Tax=Rarobacter faecitabidus TaxID=13243 RepID=UPI0011509B3F|nr:hypothetical protein [Rarobacter faecitabidus]